MLADLELGLVALIRNTPLAQRLRQVDSLPDLDGDSLIGKFVSDAPAVYVALGSFPVRGGYARPKFGIACVARNSRGQAAARHGDGVVIGLQEMLDSVMSLIDGAQVETGDMSATFEVTSCDLVTSEALYQKGVYAGVVQIQTAAALRLPAPVDADALAEFQTFHANYDVEPHQPASEHAKWLAEPPDHSTSAPELSDPLNLQE